jgi:hypothetical protein
MMTRAPNIAQRFVSRFCDALQRAARIRVERARKGCQQETVLARSFCAVP